MTPRERPIIFSDEMVRAILDGKKTQTRRVVKPRGEWIVPSTGEWMVTIPDMLRRCPYGVPGDRLWVREACALVMAPGMGDGHEDADAVWYRATDSLHLPNRWRSSIHMPRWASRITLEILDIRVQRLDYIADYEARAEGCADRAAFRGLWERIHGADSWALDPWVWTMTFRRLEAAS